MKETRTSSARIWGAALGVALSLTSSLACAQTAEERLEARASFDRGIAAAKVSDYAAALLEFQRAYALVPHFGVLYNIAQAERALGNHAASRAALRRYLEEGGAAIDSDRRAEVEAQLATGDSSDAAPEPERASSAPPAPAEPVPPPPASSSELRREAAPRVAPPTPAPVASPGAPTRATDDTRRSVAYVLAGAAAVLAGGAVAHYAWNHGRYRDWQAAERDYQSAPTEAQRARANALAQSISSASVVTVALGVGAAAMLGGGVVLFVSASPGATGGSARAWDGAVAVRGRF